MNLGTISRNLEDTVNIALNIMDTVNCEPRENDYHSIKIFELLNTTTTLLLRNLQIYFKIDNHHDHK